MSESPEQHIRRTAEERVHLFRQPQGDRVFASLRGAIEQTSQEYAGRTVLELIQNGHDAIPDGSSDGRIVVMYRSDKGAHGVLYVANTGRPFGLENFDSICDIARSDKHVDEGIGNKGVGFKSVLNFTDSPEIYSASDQAGGNERFHGYCFRFARHADLLSLTDGDGELAADLGEAVSSLSLPVPIVQGEHPEPVCHFATQRFASVVRLPLRDRTAGALLEAQLEDLCGSSPIQWCTRRRFATVISSTWR